MYKRIIFYCLIFCSYYNIFAQSCINAKVNVIGVITINKPLLFNHVENCVNEDNAEIFVKREVLMTDSLYFDSIFKTDINMGSALFDPNCYVMDYMFHMVFLTNYLIEHIPDSIYLDLLTQTYPKRYLNTYRLVFIEKKMVNSFYIQRFSQNTFLIVEMSLGLYNSLWERHFSPPCYRFSRNPEDNGRIIKLAIPLKVNY